MSNAVAEKHAALVNRLFAKTESRSLTWELDGDRQLIVSIGSHRIRLWDAGENNNPMEYISVSTAYDELIETISDEDLGDVSPKDVRFETYYLMMVALRTMAFRQAVGADKALDEVLNDLDDLL